MHFLHGAKQPFIVCMSAHKYIPLEVQEWLGTCISNIQFTTYVPRVLLYLQQIRYIAQTGVYDSIEKTIKHVCT